MVIGAILVCALTDTARVGLLGLNGGRPHRALAPRALALLSMPALAAGPMTRFEFELETARIASTFTHARAVCDALTSNTKHICVVEARAVQAIAHAELAFCRSGHPSDAAAIDFVRDAL